MSHAEKTLVVRVSQKLFDAVSLGAVKSGENRATHIRHILSNHFGVEFLMPRNGRPPKRALPPDEIEHFQSPNLADETRVQDLKSRGYSKSYVAAVTKLPYAEIERLWTA